MIEKYESCEPRPAALMISLRAFGYDLPMVVADLIDNSISAGARDIKVDYDWNKGLPWFRIVDNGSGMGEQTLREAMRLGTQSPIEERSIGDLGRFGLGLKTASFSQGKLLIVRSKISTGEISSRCWDIDHVCKTNEWELQKVIPKLYEPLFSELTNLKNGTIVLCGKLDRLPKTEQESENSMRTFLDAFEKVAKYLEMVFHRFLTGRDKITLVVGRHICKPWDPFMTMNSFTRPLSKENLLDHQIEIQPYVLPHVSKRTSEETLYGEGIKGWNAHQGFYLYRNNRMIIAGGYLDFNIKPEEHYKLCRIQLDLPNSMDHEWNIDVRKATASPPANVRIDLERIVKASRAEAVEVYRARSGQSRSSVSKTGKHDVWIRKRQGDKIIYVINKQNEVISELLGETNPPSKWIRQLFYIIERAVPFRTIVIDNSEHEDCQVELHPNVFPPPLELIELCCRIFKERLMLGKDPHEVADYVCSCFNDHPAYRAALDKIIEELSR